MATGSAPPFQVDSDGLKALFTTGGKLPELGFLLAPTGRAVGLAEFDGSDVGLYVTKDGTTLPYAWSTIASLWNRNDLHGAWGVDQSILKELLENGSCQSSLNCVLSFSFLTPNILFVLVCLLTAKKDTSGTSPQPLFYLDFLCGLWGC